MAYEKKRKAASMASQEAVAMVEEKLKKVNCDPITELASLAVDQTLALDTRINILKELAQYTAPKRRAVDIRGSGDMNVHVIIKKFSKGIEVAQGMFRPEVLEKGEGSDENPDAE